VTSDGAVRIANACTNPELFFSLRGGGGGSFGVVTRLTLRTHALPQVFGAVSMEVKSKSDEAYRRLIGRFNRFYAESLFNEHWGEQAKFRQDNTLRIDMVFQGLAQEEARAVWQPFFDFIASSPSEFALASPPVVLSLPARNFWNAAFLLKNAPGVMIKDDRPGAPDGNAFWTGDQGQVGQVLHGFKSLWLPAALLRDDGGGRLAEALFAASRHWQVSLHFNNGLAGAPAEAIAAARDTATNPAVLDAFALAIIAASGPPAFPGLRAHEPDPGLARHNAEAVGQAMAQLLPLAPDKGSYVSESDFFEAGWQRAFWGANHARLAVAKTAYDPDGLFFVHHGVGSEAWSADGFARLAGP
jgi:hypothetical protein